MPVLYEADRDDVETIFDSNVSAPHHQRVERRLLRSLVGQYIQKHSISILSFFLLLAVVQQIIIVYLSVMRYNSCVISYDNLAVTHPHLMMSAIDPQTSYQPHTDTDEVSDSKIGKEHRCGYPRCNLRELAFRKLKSYARCQQCFEGLKVSRVFKEYHGSDYGIEFFFDYGQHVQDWNNNDWAAFSNITSEFEGSFRLLQYGDNSTQVIQWYNLHLKDGF